MINFRSIVSGSSGNCSIFSDGETNILIDCGLSGKKITAFLNEMEVDPHEINGILVTHEHIDHTSGVGVFSRKYDIPVIASKGTWEGMEIGKIEDKNKIAFSKNEPMCIGGICVTPFDIPHDANQPTGFLIEKNGKRYAVATDMGYITDEVIDTLSGCTAVILEANYDEQMLKNGFVYEDFVTISTDAAGEIQSIAVNTSTANRMKTEIALAIEEKVRDLPNERVQVPYLAFFVDELVTGHGPYVEFELSPAGHCFIDFENSFSEAGINQTKHQIDIVIKADFNMMTAVVGEGVSVETSVPVAQTVIVGTVPNSYFKIQR